MPSRFDATTIEHGLNFTRSTDVGDFDALGEIRGGGTYESLVGARGQKDKSDFQEGQNRTYPFPSHDERVHVPVFGAEPNDVGYLIGTRADAVVEGE